MTRQGRITSAILRNQDNKWLAARLAEDVSNAINGALSPNQRERAERYVELVRKELRRRGIPVDFEDPGPVDNQRNFAEEKECLERVMIMELSDYLSRRQKYWSRILEINAML